MPGSDLSESLKLLRRRFFLLSLVSAFSFLAYADTLDTLTHKPVKAFAPLSVGPVTGGLSTSVLNGKTLVFRTSYSTADWSGELKAFTVTSDGALASQAWSAGAKLDAAASAGRVILSAKSNADGSFGGGIEFGTPDDLDSAAKVALMKPASVDPAHDTLQSRMDWLRGERSAEIGGALRKRNTLLGPIVRSQALYVPSPSAEYRAVWQPLSDGAVAPETNATVSYEKFSKNHAGRTPMVYVGANDGMLHAFDASQKPDGSNTASSGKELWAYVPRSGYANLGNLTQAAHYAFAPTVDATPVTRDVFFDRSTLAPAKTAKGWHTILVGGLGGGGRGMYALDVTDPDPTHADGVNVANVASKVLWEFNAGMPLSSVSSHDAAKDSADPSDLGYTYAQPNIARLANGKWAVLVPTGYFPDCGELSISDDCTAGQPSSKGYSGLFILDAQTGELICELKTLTTIPGVTSRGLSSVVLGDYNNDQIDDVAFAGDLNGNLWRYDLSDPNPANWQSHVTLAYKPDVQSAQPITVMPRLFPDPATNRFIVVFGTGKYREISESASNSATTQSIYGIRDKLDSGGHSITATRAKLQEQVLHQVTASDGSATVRGLTDNALTLDNDGWYIDLNLREAPGERVVVNPEGLFDTNRVIVTTLIPGEGDSVGALMVLNAATGGPSGALSSSSGPGIFGAGSSNVSVVGSLVGDPPTSGFLSVATVIGGARLLIPGLKMKGDATLTIGGSLWRRRSWRELSHDQ